MKSKVNDMVRTAMFAALICVATMLIKIPTIGTGGYVNVGDTVILLAVWMLGNPYAAIAAALGSGLADLLSGYAIYVPGTVIIKFVMAFAATRIFAVMEPKEKSKFPARIVSGVIAELMMIVGYLVYEAFILGYGKVALLSVAGNAIQGSVCLVLGIVLIRVIPKTAKMKVM